jgi:hypothetical protein
VAKDGNIASKDPLKVACAFNPKLLRGFSSVFSIVEQPILALLLVSHAHLQKSIK